MRNNVVSVTLDSGRILSFFAIIENKKYVQLLEWEAAGGIIEPADPEPAPPTNEERVDRLDPVLRAFLRVYATDQGISMTQLRNRIANRM